MKWLGMVRGDIGTEYVFKSKGGALISDATHKTLQDIWRQDHRPIIFIMCSNYGASNLKIFSKKVNAYLIKIGIFLSLKCV